MCGCADEKASKSEDAFDLRMCKCADEKASKLKTYALF
jgi:hypothetical protein